MNIKKHVYNYLRQNIYEGLSDKGLPDLKYYAFDWDDNLMFMTTKIIVMTENEEEVGLSTEEFAEHRHQIGVEPFSFKGTTIVGYAPDPFRNFGVGGDKGFIIDSMVAPLGPSWNDFVECINGGSIFAIITARGHTPSVLKEAIKNLIISNKNGINQNELIENLKRFQKLISPEIGDQDGMDLLNDYLERCEYAPVSYGNNGSASSPEERKNMVLKGFIKHCKEQAKELVSKILENNPEIRLEDLVPKFKNDVSMSEPLQNIDDLVDKHLMIGFSDDDQRNIDASSEFLKKEYENEPEINPVKLYLTKGGEKTRY
jgi:hypothetical protein